MVWLGFNCILQCEEAIQQNTLVKYAAKWVEQLNETFTLLRENLSSAQLINIESQIILDIHGNAPIWFHSSTTNHRMQSHTNMKNR